MTTRAGWLINDSMSAEDIRLALGAMLARSGAITARSGVIPAPNSPLQVSIGSGMAVTVAAGQAIVAKSGAQGAYPVTLDTTASLTLDNGDSAQPRIDAIVARIIDTAEGDTGTTSVAIAVVKGTQAASPSVPTYTGTATLGTALLLGTVRVPANASAGSGGLTGAGATVTDQRVYTAAAGGLLLIHSSDRSGLTQHDGLTVIEVDTGKLWTSIGGAWHKVSGPVHEASGAVYPIDGSLPSNSELVIQTLNEVVTTTVATGDWSVTLPAVVDGVAAFVPINGDLRTGAVTHALNAETQAADKVNGRAFDSNGAPMLNTAVRIVGIAVCWRSV